MSISPLLANLYLYISDERMTKLGYHMVRYADDFVVLCESADRGKAPFSTPIGLICLEVKQL